MIKLLSGNKAAAHAVKMAKPDVLAAFPITPQTPLVEELEEMFARGELGECEMVETEGENSSMSVVTAAAVVGARVFTATSSWGLAYMFQDMMYAAGMRVPVVMADVCRETPAMRGVSAGRQDIMSARDLGWTIIECETCQEIFDSLIMAYRLSEDPDILLPTVVAYDGYYLSHLSEAVDIPEQEAVDRFLAPVKEKQRTVLKPGEALAFGMSFSEKLYAEYRYKNMEAIERVKQKLPQIEAEFEAVFGRAYGGLVEGYRADDAELLVITAGSISGTAREVVDSEREKGEKVGLVRLRVTRPFPRRELGALLEGKKAAVCLDNSICLGWNCGHIFMETRAVLPDLQRAPRMIDCIDGISNLDVVPEHFEQALELARRAAAGGDVPEVSWLIW